MLGEGGFRNGKKKGRDSKRPSAGGSDQAHRKWDRRVLSQLSLAKTSALPGKGGKGGPRGIDRERLEPKSN